MTFAKMDKTLISFILLIIIIFVNQKIIYDLNKTYIGKIIILICIIWFSTHNLVLALLLVFAYFMILEKYKYIIEGMTEQQIDTPNTIGEIDEKRKIVISTSSPPTGINI